MSAVFSGPGNEFIFGGGQIITFRNSGDFNWGRQYIVDFIVRPIPSQIWPTKYTDAWRFLGMENLYNLSEEGYGNGSRFQTAYGWKGTKGAAPGLISDLWFNFSMLYVVACYFVGFGYGRTWRYAQMRGGVWLVSLGIITSLSVYLFWQNVESFGFRMLLMLGASWVILQAGNRASREVSGRSETWGVNNAGGASGIR
jgi:hypothetical protein